MKTRNKILAGIGLAAILGFNLSSFKGRVTNTGEYNTYDVGRLSVSPEGIDASYINFDKPFAKTITSYFYVENGCKTEEKSFRFNQSFNREEAGYIGEKDRKHLNVYVGDYVTIICGRLSGTVSPWQIWK